MIVNENPIFVIKYKANYLAFHQMPSINVNAIKLGDYPVEPGCKIQQIGSKKRTMFAMQPGKFLQYEGWVLFDDSIHLLFSPQGKQVYYDNMFWFYTFVLIENSNILYLSSSRIGGSDIVADQIIFYSESII